MNSILRLSLSAVHPFLHPSNSRVLSRFLTSWRYDPETHSARIPETTNYFELFGLDPKDGFDIDGSLVKARFLALQRSLHPDKFTLKPKEDQEYSERLSARVNEGYKTLSSPLLRALYYLGQSGLEIGEQEATDPALLMEVMELREHLDETSGVEALTKLKAENQARMKETERIVSQYFKEGKLQEAKLETIKLRYWGNMQAAIEQKIFDQK